MASRCFSPPLRPVAAVADDGVEALGQLGDEVADLGRVQGRVDLVVGGVGPGVEQVGANRVVEQVRLLGHDADAVAQGGHRHVAQVESADAHRALARVVEPRHERGEGRLAGARGTDEGDEVARPGR